MENEIYCKSNTSIMFDLNDLPNEIFWKLNEYVDMSIENINREKELKILQNEHEKKILDVDKSLINKLKKIKDIYPDPYNSKGGLGVYEYNF